MTYKSFGFIVTRHVKNIVHGQYWKRCYQHIRQFYPDTPIIFIDDYSDYEFIDTDFEKTLTNCQIIQSTSKGRGELLSYYFFLKQHTFDIAICIHDSVFLNSKLNVNFDEVTDCMFLWTFEHNWDNPTREVTIIKNLKNSDELLQFYHKKNEWLGCFGCMSIINHEFVKQMDELYDFDILIDNITNRSDRMCLERIFACMVQNNVKTKSLFGNIHTYCRWGITFDEVERYQHLPATKVWSSR